MPLRPFPYQLGIGTDLVHVSRIRAILQKAQGSPDRLERFLRRFLLPFERNDFYKTQERLHGNQLDVNSKHLAGRWAAKEAVIKAVSWRRLSFHDILIHRARHNDGVVAIILDKETLRNSAHPESTSTRQIGKVKPRPNEEFANQVETQSTLLGNGALESTEKRLDQKAVLADQTALEDPLQIPSWSNDSLVEERHPGEMQGQIAKVSISHDGDYATAMCIAAEEPAEGDVGGEASAREPL